MHTPFFKRWLFAGNILLSAVSFIQTARAGDSVPLGLFTDQTDVGKPSTLGAGSGAFDAAKGVYTITGGGENMWAAADHFHYVYKKMSGDITLAATIEFVGTA